MAAISQLTFLPPMADALLYQHDILASARIDQAQPGVILVNPAEFLRSIFDSNFEAISQELIVEEVVASCVMGVDQWKLHKGAD